MIVWREQWPLFVYLMKTMGSRFIFLFKIFSIFGSQTSQISSLVCCSKIVGSRICIYSFFEEKEEFSDLDGQFSLKFVDDGPKKCSFFCFRRSFDKVAPRSLEEHSIEQIHVIILSAGRIMMK